MNGSRNSRDVNSTFWPGAIYGLASAIGEEPEPYRRLRSDIGKLLRVPSGEFDGEAGFDDLLRPQRSGSADSEIFPPDDRRLVANTLLVPFRFICCLEIIFVNPLNGLGLLERGTGTLISDRHVLTAAHCVFDDQSTKNAKLPPGLGPFPVRYLRGTTHPGRAGPQRPRPSVRLLSLSPRRVSPRGGRRRRTNRRHWETQLM